MTTKTSLIKRYGDALARRDGGWVCAYCGRQLEKTTERPNDPAKACVDHVAPQCKGGTDSLDNCVLTCRSCNSKKGRSSAYPLRIKDSVWKQVARRFLGVA